MDYFGFGYAAIVASGGVIGYVKAGDINDITRHIRVYIHMKEIYSNSQLSPGQRLPLALATVSYVLTVWPSALLCRHWYPIFEAIPNRSRNCMLL